MDSHEEGRKKMGFGQSTDLKLYESKRIEAEKWWVLSETTDLDSFKEGRKKMGFGRSTDLKCIKVKG